MTYSGTLVTAGSGVGVAVATGGQTELGQIHRLVGGAETLATPLTEKLARFSKILTVVILALAAATFAVGVARGQDTVACSPPRSRCVGAIPEGLGGGHDHLRSEGPDGAVASGDPPARRSRRWAARPSSARQDRDVDRESDDHEGHLTRTGSR
jgi:hypothetical protein